MRRKISLILSVLFLVIAVIPMQVFAAEADKGLEDAIRLVKEKFTVPDNFTDFNYNINTEGNRKVWYLNWHSKDENNGSISVSVSDQGKVLNYDYYKPYDYSGQKKLPKVSMQEARTMAEDFIKKVEPGLMDKISFRENNYGSAMEPEYSFNFIRVENGVPFYANSVNVRVNRQTGEVRGYYLNWSDDLVFPTPEKAITMVQAQKAFKEKLGLNLQYNYSYDDNGVKLYSVYAPVYGQNYIDAFTGEKLDLDSIYHTMNYDQAMMEKTMAASSGAKSEVQLTAEEMEAVKKVSKLITKEEAEKIARDMKNLGLTDEFKASYASLSKDWPNNEEFVWQLSFSKEAKNKMDYYGHANVRINALTKEIRSFYVSTPYQEGTVAKYDEKAAKQAAETLLKELQPVKFAQTQFDENYKGGYYPLSSTEKPREYSLRYIRKVNGIPFPGNSMIVRYDAVNGKITSYEMNWFDLSFPAVDNAMNLEQVYQKMFSDIGLELQYVTNYPVYRYEILPDNSGVKPEIKLAYTVKPGKPLMFDAVTGDVLDYNGKPYKQIKAAEYTDIDGHYAESQIKVLAENGISLDGSTFRPDDKILQKEFLYLLSRTLNYYYYRPYITKEDDREIEEMYKQLVREGIIKESEKAPDSALSREDSVKFLIRAMKYDKVADIKGIYNCTFKDIEEISPELVGYVTIAQGLEITSGYDGYFNPKGELTRAQGAVLIYNYLKAN